jgi:hypothetical protein
MDPGKQTCNHAAISSYVSSRRRIAMNYKILCAVLVLALASMACGFSIDLPKRTEAGPEITDPINIAVPNAEPVQLTISFGAGKLTMNPGAGDGLVQGTATYNLSDLKPQIHAQGGSIQLTQGEYKFSDVVTTSNIKNVWDLKLGSVPMDLTIEAGAYDGTMELGGLALRSLSVKDGAANTELSFASPNAAQMSMLRYETGASSVKLAGLANANFSTMTFRSGAGDYELDFSGDLQRDATISVGTGLSDMTLRIPKGVHAVVTITGGLNNVSTSSGWSQNGDTYTQDGDGPTLTFIVDMGAGNLTLTD